MIKRRAKKSVARWRAEIVKWAVDAGVDVGLRDSEESLRFAAHEAAHAIDLRLPRSTRLKLWTSDEIHDALSRLHSKADVVRAEIRARAGEWLVCEALGLDYDHRQWALISVVESCSNELGAKLPRNTADLIYAAKNSDSVEAIAKQILTCSARLNTD